MLDAYELALWVGGLLMNHSSRVLDSHSKNQLTSAPVLVKLIALKEIADDSKLPIALRDLATLYEVYVFGSEIEGKMDQLNALSGPDRPYRVLAMQAKVDLLIGDNAFEDALVEIDLIEASLSPSSERSSRIKNLRQIIQSKISSD